MSIFGGLSTPEWLNPERLFASGEASGRDNANTFMQAYQQAKKEKIEQPMRDLQMASGVLNLQKQAAGLQVQEAQAKNLGEDQNSIPQWLKDHSTWSSRQDADWPTPKTSWGEKVLNDTRVRDSASIAKTAAVSDLHNYSKDLAAIDPTSRAAIQGMTPNKDGTPSAMQWESLNLAKQSMAVEGDNARMETEIQARARGDDVSTTIGPKGTSITVKTPKLVSGAGGTITEPQVKTFDDGTSVVYNPKGGGFHILQKDNKTKAMSNPEMERLYEKTDDEDWKKALGEELKKRSGVGGTNKPTASAPIKPVKFSTKEDVKSAYDSGKLSRDDALKILKDQFKLQ